ncbi:MAG: GNAT family N-acetyltransferase, partial [Lachnospiraceae bacterium]|nr:GNAT family N-acetyltransferase [Lachnospiraceae bacterium]
GEALLCFSQGEYMLSYFGILPEERGKGYGTMALKRILREYFPLILSVDEDSDAYRLYERCGFEPYRYDITFVVGR